ncbi:COP9 signalosome complex subunit 7 [Asimina triloba]
MVLPYDQLMLELDVSNVRELEDFLINECMYAVQFAAGRDLRPDQLGSMIQTLTTWLTTSDNLLLSIQEKIKWADTMGEADRKHRKEIEERIEEVKKTLKMRLTYLVAEVHCKQADVELRGHEEIVYSEPGGVMDYEEDRSRPKRGESSELVRPCIAAELSFG